MTEFLVAVLAGVFAGAINAIVGSGTLLTYPFLLTLGLPPIVANGTNNVGLSVGGAASAWAYRAELRPRLRVLAVPMLLTVSGAVIGSSLVVRLPQRVFVTVVPWLILGAVVLVALQPVIVRRLARRAHHSIEPRRDLPAWTGLLGVYGGYFGAGIGILMLAVLSLLGLGDVHVLNAVKNLLAAVVNSVATAVLVAAAVAGGFEVSWLHVAVLAAGSILGGIAVVRLSRRLPAVAVRRVVAVIAFALAGYYFLREYFLREWTG